MKLYAEESMSARRSAFESEVLAWPGVRADKKFGCPCYNTNDLLFAFLVTDGIVITNLDETGRAVLAKIHRGTPFKPRGSPIEKWSQVPYFAAADLGLILPYVRASYEAAKAAPPKQDVRAPVRKTKVKKIQIRSKKRPRI